MIGQINLLNKLRTYTIDTFPRTVILAGEKGMGKHTLANLIRDEIIGLPLLDITSNLSAEYIDEIYRNPNPMIYMIDMSEMTEKSQNILLKFAEEPLNNAFVILLVENKSLILNTILNRAVVFELEPYTKDELRSFITNEADAELILEILRTPGKILNTNINNIREMFDVCDKIVNKIDVANYPNTLTIAKKINFKDDYNKFDLDIFFDILCFSLFSQYLSTNDPNMLKMYSLTRDQRKKLVDKRLNKELLFENLLTKLWKLSRGYDYGY